MKAATLNNAISLNLDNQLGTIAKGKIADLVVLSKNPLNDLDNLKSVERVIKSGYEHSIN
ncbi:MAG: amidohydrolase family protein [Flavobacteriaceae bacterium]